jgi:myo-inositol 2-dehydrogenase/D-chiro-inositol 1-dehydrogenase
MVSTGLHPTWFERLEPSFALALDAFISALEGKQTSYPSLMDGLRAQIIAEAAIESLHKNQPVKITYWQPE